MSDRDIIIALAERVMGWTQYPYPKSKHLWLDIGGPDYLAYSPGEIGSGYWNPLESIADAFEVQAAIPEAKQREFGAALFHILKSSRILYTDVSDWDMANATPRQRCLAAIEAVNESADSVGLLRGNHEKSQ